MKFFILFLLATAFNVTISTIKSIVTVKGGKMAAAILNAVTYGFYTYVIILTNGDGLSTLAKMLITAGCNFVCVYLVKYIEEKNAPEKMWKIECAFQNAYDYEDTMTHQNLEKMGIPNNFNRLGSWTVFNCYCDTRKKTAELTEFVKLNDGKMSAYESKI